MEENTGFMDKLALLVTDFDMANFIPKLDSVIGWVELAARVAVMAGPILLLILGAVYFFIPPKEANHSLGYRFYWGMGSVEAWQFTQKLAGIVWSILGFVLCIIMTVQSGKFQGMEADAMAYLAMKYLLVELVCVVVSILLINLTVFVCFNHKGILREFLQRGPSQRSPRNRANRR